uniref:Uncharacterized protein n=1 Tax=Micrurus lemniscatus lemniscatus TaxID=129467 RepID=A0A2D4IEJ3_MICLE
MTWKRGGCSRRRRASCSTRRKREGEKTVQPCPLPTTSGPWTTSSTSPRSSRSCTHSPGQLLWQQSPPLRERERERNRHGPVQGGAKRGPLPKDLGQGCCPLLGLGTY